MCQGEGHAERKAERADLKRGGERETKVPAADINNGQDGGDEKRNSTQNKKISINFLDKFEKKYI